MLTRRRLLTFLAAAPIAAAGAVAGQATAVSWSKVWAEEHRRAFAIARRLAPDGYETLRAVVAQLARDGIPIIPAVKQRPAE